MVFQDTVVVPRPVMVVGEAASAMVGALALLTITWRLAVCEPAMPVQVRAYVVLAESVADIVPEVGLDPLQPPDAMQLCAPLADHCSVTVSPAVMFPGDN